MNMEKKIFFRIILLILILTFAFLVIRTTYSKYLTQTDDNASLHIANWNIKLNNKDISEAKNFTNNINVILNENNYVDEGVIAPTSSGSFKLKLESTGTELPFQYELQVAGKGDFDTVSTYEVLITNYGTWNEGTPWAGAYASITLCINYSYRTTPIKYTSPNGEPLYDALPITFTFINAHTASFNNNNWDSSFSYENGYVYIVPQQYQWSDNNVVSLYFQAQFNDALSKEEIISSFSNIAIDGKPIGNPVELPDFKITSYTKNGSEIIPVDVNTNFSDIVEPPVDADGNFTGQEVINDYTFYFEWYDGEENVLDNYGDVNISKLTSNATIPLSLKITQIEEKNAEENKDS